MDPSAVAKDESPEGEGGKSLHEEQPFVSAQAEDTIELEKQTGERRSDDGDDRRGHEDRNRARAIRRGKPVRHVENDTREETGFGGTEQEAQQVKRSRPFRAHHAGGDDPPHDHDARDPHPRSTRAENQVRRRPGTRNSRQERCHAEAIDRVGEAEIGDHLLLGETYVHPIEERGHEAAPRNGMSL